MDTKNTRKLHNPKSHSPAVYIPCWLIQIPNKLLSHGAKLVYGRLSQWATEHGHVFRSVPQLSKELGMCESSVEKYQKELKDCELIGTYHPQAGGVNHFEFYDHPWMHEPLTKELVYKSEEPHEDPPYKHTAPPVQSYGTPPYKHTDINNTKVKEVKNTSVSVDNSCVNPNPLNPILDATTENLLLEIFHVLNDPRSDEEFLSQAAFHIENGDKAYNYKQRVNGLIVLLKRGKFKTPQGYISKIAPKKTQHSNIFHVADMDVISKARGLAFEALVKAKKKK